MNNINTKINSNAKIDNNSKIDKIQIQFNDFESQYNLLLQQYQASFNEYTDSFFDSSTKYTAYSGSTWWGGGTILDQGSTTTQSECEDMCSKNKTCTGATFNPDKQYCWTSAGNGNVVPGLNSDFALLPLRQDKLRNLRSINEQLTNLNNNMNALLEKLHPIAEYEYLEKNKKQKELTLKNDQLEEKQRELLLLIKETETLEEQYNNNTLAVSQQNSLFKLWLIIVVILTSLVMKLFINPSKANNVMFVLILAAVCLGIYYYFR